MSDPREKILAHACDLYLEEGLDGFSMRKLARAVGVTAPALYRHFESREHVLGEVVREAYREFSAYLYRGLEGRTAQERLSKAGDGYLEFALEHPRWYQMVYIAPERLGVEALPEDIEAQGCAIHQFWVDRLRECMHDGLLRPGDPAEVGLTLWAHTHGLIRLYHTGHLRMDEEQFRALYRASGARILMGMATETYRAEIARRMEAEWPAPAGSARTA